MFKSDCYNIYKCVIKVLHNHLNALYPIYDLRRGSHIVDTFFHVSDFNFSMHQKFKINHFFFYGCNV